MTSSREETGAPSTPIDHLVYASPDLSAGIDTITEKLGVRARPGGRHPDFGTRNALIALGPQTYLEIIGPDPEGDVPGRPRIFKLDELDAPRLVTWAARATDLERRAAAARAEGVDLGGVKSGRRQRSDGTILTWRFTDPAAMPGDGIVPFLIDWGESLSPATHATPGSRLLELTAEHPEADRVRSMLEVLDLDLRITAGPTPKLIATIDSPAGSVKLC